MERRGAPASSSNKYDITKARTRFALPITTKPRRWEPCATRWEDSRKKEQTTGPMETSTTKSRGRYNPAQNRKRREKQWMN